MASAGRGCGPRRKTGAIIECIEASFTPRMSEKGRGPFSARLFLILLTISGGALEDGPRKDQAEVRSILLARYANHISFRTMGNEKDV